MDKTVRWSLQEEMATGNWPADEMKHDSKLNASLGSLLGFSIWLP